MVFYDFQVLTVTELGLWVAHQMPVRSQAGSITCPALHSIPLLSRVSWDFYPPQAEGRAGVRGTDLIVAGSPLWKPRRLGSFLTLLSRLPLVLSSSSLGCSLQLSLPSEPLSQWPCHSFLLWPNSLNGISALADSSFSLPLLSWKYSNQAIILPPPWNPSSEVDPCRSLVDGLHVARSSDRISVSMTWPQKQVTPCFFLSLDFSKITLS